MTGEQKIALAAELLEIAPGELKTKLQGKGENIEQLCTIGDACARLSVSDSTIRRLIRTRQLRAYKIADAVRISYADLASIMIPVTEGVRSKRGRK